VFGTQNPDIKIKLEQEPSPTDTKTKIIAAAKAGQLPDVVTIDPAWLPELVDMGALQPLENLWPAEDRKDLPAAMTQIPMINGHLYSLWFMTDVRALYYRKDLLQAQGLQPPKTWDDLRKVAAALNNPAKGQWGFGFTLGNTQNTLDASVTPQFLSQGGQFVDDQGNPTVLKGKNRPIIEGIFQYYHDLMYVDKVLSPSSLEIKDTDSTIGRVCAGELAMWVGGSWQPYQIKEQCGAQLPNWDVTDLPIKAGAKPTTVGGGWNFGITTKDPERQKAAWKLVYFLSLPENQAAWGMNWLSYPTRFSATKDPWFSQDPLMKRFGDIQPTWQFYAATSPIWNAMSTELVQAFTGYMANKMDLKPALDAADKNIDAAWAQLKK
jgi:multiple sugar transport system substrate-binding protein